MSFPASADPSARAPENIPSPIAQSANSGQKATAMPLSRNGLSAATKAAAVSQRNSATESSRVSMGRPCTCAARVIRNPA